MDGSLYVGILFITAILVVLFLLLYSGLKTSETPSEVIVTQTQTPVDCQGTWSDWGQCVNGSQSNTFTVTQQALYGGKACPDPLVQRRTCTVQTPVDCQGTWSDWGQCVNGSQSNTFTVTQQALYGGKACPSPLVQTRPCTVECKGDWSGWGECTPDNKQYNVFNVTATGTLQCPPENQRLMSRDCQTTTTDYYADASTKCGYSQEFLYTLDNTRVVQIATSTTCPPPQGTEVNWWNTQFSQKCPMDTWTTDINTKISVVRNNQSCPSQPVIQQDPIQVYNSRCPSNADKFDDATKRNIVANQLPCPVYPTYYTDKFDRSCTGAQATPVDKKVDVAKNNLPCPDDSYYVNLYDTKCQGRPDAATKISQMKTLGTCKPIDCVASWVTTSPCNPSTGNSVQTYTITQYPFDGGKACETSNLATKSVPCNVDCDATWSSWSPCNTTGTQTRTYSVKQSSWGSGKACEAPNNTIQTQNCPVNCVGTWSGMSACDPATGKQTNTFTVTQRPLNGGTACPANQVVDCAVDCGASWATTSTCNPLTGNSIQTYTIYRTAKNGGKACETSNLATKSVPCNVDCVATTGAWSACDPATSKQTRTVTVTQNKWGSGLACPPSEQACTVPCNGTWNEQACDPVTRKQYQVYNTRNTPCEIKQGTERFVDCDITMSKDWYLTNIPLKCSIPYSFLTTLSVDRLKAIYYSTDCSLTAQELTALKGMVTSGACVIPGVKDAVIQQSDIFNMYSTSCAIDSLPTEAKNVVMNLAVTKCSNYPADFIKSLSSSRLVSIAQLTTCPNPSWFTRDEFKWFTDKSTYPAGFFDMVFYTNDEIFDAYTNNWKIRDFIKWSMAELQFWKNWIKSTCPPDKEPPELVDNYSPTKVYKYATGQVQCGYRSTNMIDDQAFTEFDNYWYPLIFQKIYPHRDPGIGIELYDILLMNSTYVTLNGKQYTTGDVALQVAYGNRPCWTPRPNSPSDPELNYRWWSDDERRYWQNVAWQLKPIVPLNFLMTYFQFYDYVIIGALQNGGIDDKWGNPGGYTTGQKGWFFNEYKRVCGLDTTDIQLAYDVLMNKRSCGGGTPSETNANYLKRVCPSTAYNDTLFNVYGYTQANIDTAAYTVMSKNGQCTAPLFLTDTETTYWKDQATQKCGEGSRTNVENFTSVTGSCKTNAPPWSTDDFNYWVGKAQAICSFVTKDWTQDDVYKVLTDKKCLLRNPSTSTWSQDEKVYWTNIMKNSCPYVDTIIDGFTNDQVYYGITNKKCSVTGSWSDDTRNQWVQKLIDKKCTTLELYNANKSRWTDQIIYDAVVGTCPAENPDSWNDAEKTIWKTIAKQKCGFNQDPSYWKNWSWTPYYGDRSIPIDNVPNQKIYQIATNAICPSQRPNEDAWSEQERNYWKAAARSHCPNNWDSSGNFKGWDDISQMNIVYPYQDGAIYSGAVLECPPMYQTITPSVQTTEYTLALTGIRWYRNLNGYGFELDESDTSSALFLAIIQIVEYFRISNIREFNGSVVDMPPTYQTLQHSSIQIENGPNSTFVYTDDRFPYGSNRIGDFTLCTQDFNLFISIVNIVYGIGNSDVNAQMCAIIQGYISQNPTLSAPSWCTQSSTIGNVPDMPSSSGGSNLIIIGPDTTDQSSAYNSWVQGDPSLSGLGVYTLTDTFANGGKKVQYINSTVQQAISTNQEAILFTSTQFVYFYAISGKLTKEVYTYEMTITSLTVPSGTRNIRIPSKPEWGVYGYNGSIPVTSVAHRNDVYTRSDENFTDMTGKCFTGVYNGYTIQYTMTGRMTARIDFIGTTKSYSGLYYTCFTDTLVITGLKIKDGTREFMTEEVFTLDSSGGIRSSNGTLYNPCTSTSTGTGQVRPFPPATDPLWTDPNYGVPSTGTQTAQSGTLIGLNTQGKIIVGTVGGAGIGITIGTYVLAMAWLKNRNPDRMNPQKPIGSISSPDSIPSKSPSGSKYVFPESGKKLPSDIPSNPIDLIFPSNGLAKPSRAWRVGDLMSFLQSPSKQHPLAETLGKARIMSTISGAFNKGGVYEGVNRALEKARIYNIPKTGSVNHADVLTVLHDTTPFADGSKNPFGSGIEPPSTLDDVLAMMKRGPVTEAAEGASRLSALTNGQKIAIASERLVVRGVPRATVSAAASAATRSEATAARFTMGAASAGFTVATMAVMVAEEVTGKQSMSEFISDDERKRLQAQYPGLTGVYDGLSILIDLANANPQGIYNDVLQFGKDTGVKISRANTISFLNNITTIGGTTGGGTGSVGGWTSAFSW